MAWYVIVVVLVLVVVIVIVVLKYILLNISGLLLLTYVILKQVFDIGKGTNTAITGLQYHRVPKSDNYFIVVTTMNRLYYFVGRSNPDDKPLLQQLFNSYLNIPERNFHEICNKSKYSKLRFWYDKNECTPKAFGWMTEEGIFYSEVNSYTCLLFTIILIRFHVDLVEPRKYGEFRCD